MDDRVDAGGQGRSDAVQELLAALDRLRQADENAASEIRRQMEAWFGGGGKTVIDKLVPDPNDPPAVRLLTGYRGQSPRAEHVRLYADLELTRYLEISEDSIVLQVDVPTEHPVEGLVYTKLWVKADATIIRVTNQSFTFQQQFVRGEAAQPAAGGCTCGQAWRPGYQLGHCYCLPCACASGPAVGYGSAGSDHPWFDFSSRSPC